MRTEEITSRKNPLISHIKKLYGDRSYRRECGEFACEGEKLLEDAVAAGKHIINLLTSDTAVAAASAADRTVMVPDDIIDSLSAMKSPRPVIFTCGIENSAAVSGRKLVLLENMQDPGNVGTIIRTSNALGVDEVLLVGDCADPFGPKTVRASMGAVFREKVTELGYSELETLIDDTGLPLYGTYPDGEMTDIRTVGFTEGIIAVGSEGSGISERLRSMCSFNITIPMLRGCEALNAAAAATVLIWEMCGKNL